MKYIYITLFLLIGFQNLNGQDLLENKIVDIENNLYTKESLEKENIFFLIASLHCGYCLNDIKYYNALADKYSNLSSLKFIVLLEDNRNYINEFKMNNLFFNKNWLVIPNAESYYSKIWKEELFPEYVIYLQGKQIKAFAFSNRRTKIKIRDFLLKLIAHNKI